MKHTINTTKSNHFCQTKTTLVRILKDYFSSIKVPCNQSTQKCRSSFLHLHDPVKSRCYLAIMHKEIAQQNNKIRIFSRTHIIIIM